MSGVTIDRTPRESEPGYTVDTFAEKTQKQYLSEYRKKYPVTKPTADGMRPNRQERYTPPRDHNAHFDHMKNFLTAVKTRKPFFEDALFGYRTAGPSLAVNLSLEEQRPVGWDVEKLVAS